MSMKVIFCVFVLFLISVQAQTCPEGCFPCDKVTNPNDCVVSGNSSLALKYPTSEITTNSMVNNVSACVKIAFNNICLNIDWVNWGNFFDNITISITVDKITVFSFTTTLPDLMTDGGVCLDDDTVLEILLLIPSLQQDAEIILKLLEITGCKPNGLFSFCFFFTPCEYQTQLNNQLLEFPCGCFSMTFDLLYWRNYCVVSEQVEIGCVA